MCGQGALQSFAQSVVVWRGVHVQAAAHFDHFQERPRQRETPPESVARVPLQNFVVQFQFQQFRCTVAFAPNGSVNIRRGGAGLLALLPRQTARC